MFLRYYLIYGIDDYMRPREMLVSKRQKNYNPHALFNLHVDIDCV